MIYTDVKSWPKQYKFLLYNFFIIQLYNLIFKTYINFLSKEDKANPFYTFLLYTSNER
jgi:hypothetical protein